MLSPAALLLHRPGVTGTYGSGLSTTCWQAHTSFSWPPMRCVCMDACTRHLRMPGHACAWLNCAHIVTLGPSRTPPPQCQEEEFALSRALLQPYVDAGTVNLVEDYRCAREFQEQAYNTILSRIRDGQLAHWSVLRWLVHITAWPSGVCYLVCIRALADTQPANHVASLPAVIAPSCLSTGWDSSTWMRCSCLPTHCKPLLTSCPTECSGRSHQLCSRACCTAPTGTLLLPTPPCSRPTFAT